MSFYGYEDRSFENWRDSFYDVPEEDYWAPWKEDVDEDEKDENED